MAMSDSNNFLRSVSGTYLWTRPKNHDFRSSYYDEQEERMRWGIDQAVARGLISPQEAEEAKAANQRTWWDNLFGFEESSRNLFGSVGQPIIDTLSLGNYATAAATAATIDDPLVQIGSFKVGFTPSAFLREFKKRPTFSNFVESFWTGLALDIAIDPITYLTFGVESGVKVGTKGVTKVGTKTLASGTSKLTLTRHGAEIYHLAANRLRPAIEEALKKEGVENISGRAMIELHDNIGRYMINNYASLKHELFQNMGRWRKFKSTISEGSRKTVDNLIAAASHKSDVSFMQHTAEDMFVETTRLHQKDFGVKSLGVFVPSFVKSVTRDVANTVAPNFNRLHGVPNDVRDMAVRMRERVTRIQAERTREVEEALQDLNHNELELVTRVLEAGDEEIGLAYHPNQRRMMHYLSTGENSAEYIPDKVMKAAEFARRRFAEIAQRENEAGFKIETVKDYVHRVYKTKEARAAVLAKIGDNPYVGRYSGKQSFQMNRIIASLDDAIESFGEDFVEMNIGKILAKREAASIKMIELENFYDYIKANYGITDMMIVRATNEGVRTSSKLKTFLKSNTKEPIELEIDDIRKLKDAKHVRLGFGFNRESNFKLIEYLSKTPEERIAEKAGKAPNVVAKLHPQITSGFVYNGNEVSVVDVLRAHYDGYISIPELVRAHNGGKLTLSYLKGFINKLDDYFRKNFDAPIEVIFPDFKESLESSLLKTKEFSKKTARATRAGKIGFSDDIFSNIALIKKIASGDVAKLSSEAGKLAGASLEFSHNGNKYNVIPLLESLADHSPASLMLYAGNGGLTSVENLLKSLNNYFMKTYKVSVVKAFPMLPRLIRESLMKIDEFTEVVDGVRVQKTYKGKPIIDETVRRALGNVEKDYGGRTFRTRGGKSVIDSLFKRIERPHKLRFETVPALPEEMVQRARVMRVVYGDYSDVATATAKQLKRIKKVSEKLGIQSEHIATLSEALTGKADVTKLSKREADSLLQYLAVTAGEYSARTGEITTSLFSTSLRKVVFNAKGKPKFEKVGKLVKLADNGSKYLSEAEDAVRNAEAMLREIDASDIPINEKVEKLAEARKVFEQRKEAYNQAREALGSAVDKEGPLITADKRKFISSDEIIERNAEVLSEKEISSIGNRAGVKRESIKATKLTVNEGSLIKKYKAARKNIEKKYANDPLTMKKKIAELEDEIFKTDVRLVGSGKYWKDGKIHDIIFKKTSMGHIIVGKDADEIRIALAREAAKDSAFKIDAYRPALKAELPEEIVGMPGGDYYLPEDIANFIEDLNTPLYSPGASKMVNNFLKAYDRIQNIYKVPLLAPWFSTMARNAIGNVSLVYLRAGLSLLNPDYVTDFTKVLAYTLANESETIRKLLVKGGKKHYVEKLGRQVVKSEADHGVKMTIAELSKEFGELGVFSAWMRHEVFDVEPSSLLKQRIYGGATGAGIGFSVGGPSGALVGAAIGALIGKESYRMTNLFRFQELASEIPTRIMLALHTYKRTGSVIEAGAETRRFLHDYGELSVFERRFMRRLFPFYNFTKLLVRTYATEFFEHPGRVILPHKIFNAQNVTGAFFDVPAMPEDVPDFFHKQLAFLGKDYDEETGKLKTWVYTGLNLPFEEALQLAEIIAPGGEDFTQLASRTSFLPTSVAEYVLNYDTFRGGAIYPDIKKGIKITQFENGRPFKNSPEWMKKLVGYTVDETGQERVDPRIAWLIGEIPTSRFINLSKKIWEVDEEEGRRLNYWHLATQVLGVAQYKYDEETKQYFQNKKKVEAMATVLSNIRRLKSYDIDKANFPGGRPGRRRKIRNPFDPSGGRKGLFSNR